MPEVFSVYNCGTSHNRQNLDETVADLARRSAGAENRDWMINDGPGSYSHNADKSARALDQSLAAQAKTPGTRDPITGLKEASAFAVIRGAVSGYGWEHNVDHTMAVLNATRDLPHTINMAGWSRGAITCFMIAHALYENPRTTTIAVNIFALDPVPGPGNFDDPEKVTLPANVRNYAAIVQQDERRKIFKPVLIDEDIAPGIKNRFYYMPGGHSTGVFRSRNEIGLIATFLVHVFCRNTAPGLTTRSSSPRATYANSTPRFAWTRPSTKGVAEALCCFWASSAARSRTDFRTRAISSTIITRTSSAKCFRWYGRRWNMAWPPRAGRHLRARWRRSKSSRPPPICRLRRSGFFPERQEV